MGTSEMSFPFRTARYLYFWEEVALADKYIFSFKCNMGEIRINTYVSCNYNSQ